MALGEISRFMDALSSQESGGDPTARNSESGAYGQWQIMPSNWAPWAKEAGLGHNAAQNAENQYKVARHKMSAYYRQYGSWEAVAVAWFAGPSRAARYVQGDKSVLSLSDGNMRVGEYIDKMRDGMGKMAQRDEMDLEAQESAEPDAIEDDNDATLFNLFGAVSDSIAKHETPFGDDESGLMAFFKDMDSRAEEMSADGSGATAEMPQAPLPPGVVLDDEGNAQDAGSGGGDTASAQGKWDAGEILDWGQQVANAFGIDITSHKRSEERNDAVGGAENSDHLWGGGLDFAAEGREQELALYRWLKPFEGKGAIRLVLDEGDHIHVSFERGSSARVPSPTAASGSGGAPTASPIKAA